MTSIAPINNSQLLSHSLIKEKKQSLIGRHAVWLQKERHGAQKVFVVALMIGEAALAALSLVGLALIAKGFSSYQRVKNYKQLETKQPPASLPPPDRIDLKSKTATFNHVNDYCLHEGALWVRPRNQINSPWEMIYFDALNKKNKPVEIKADGANLIVLDNERTIHYKKVLQEKRDRKDQYSYTDISTKDNWTSAWYSFPLLRRIYHLFAPFRLKLPEDRLSWAISHRGKYNRHFEDASGKAHPEFAMVSTIYLLPKEGDRILYADPFLTRSFTYEIKLPEGVRGLKIDASASTLLLEAVNQEGNIEYYTLLADFDVLGHNPFLPGFYSKKARASSEWVKQPLDGVANQTGGMTISQTGEGNAARLLRIGGTNAEGKAGFYEKPINEKGWNFVQTS